MPTSTFFNLPPPKREKLLRAAVAEFARKPYGEVSINRIIQAAEIPRGSFYQYFSDKTDLFYFVLRHFSKGLEGLLLECLNACGGRLMEMPLDLYDRVAARFHSDGDDFRRAAGIIRQNAGLDLSRFGDLNTLRRNIAERLDLSGLDVKGTGDVEALMELLWESVVHALAFVCCGKLTEQEGRDRLTRKVALIRRGVEIKEELSC